MSRVRPIIAASLFLCLSACPSPGGSAIDEARDALAAQDYIAAEQHVRTTLSQMPDDTGALDVLARAQLAMGQGAVALATLDRLGRAGGSPEDADLLAAEAHLQTGDAGAARDLLEGQESAEAWRLRALAATLNGEFESARSAFARGRTASGEKGKLLAAEASFHLSRGDITAAEEAVTLAQDTAPGRIETLFVAARLAEARAEPLLALSNYLRIIEIAPLDRPALIAAIAASERAGRREVTRHLIAYGAQTRPLDSEFVYQQARVEAWDGRWGAVRERLQAYETELAKHDPARLLYAEALLNLGQVETARAIAAPIIARRSGDAEAVRLQAEIEAAS
ncbi:tetratricopeptide repeat protein [Aurantiacibacter poecillastricola]|uniref:tetratricopeptide repeat protein n=1 Tax=Aurantiacibacter poecillastricola TaxID=3064385 RepID=UPI00273EF506|nr:tetratricopeptide repeat protein [Aurantiacibacter sp. 219JJ12-13]MDP5262063.1 tetratricopeptide repeat protein [Aurantiacibacter sp. 219JJ12-13]